MNKAGILRLFAVYGMGLGVFFMSVLAIQPAHAQTIALTATTDACSNNHNGKLRYNGSDIEYCDGTTWATLATTADILTPDGTTQHSNSNTICPVEANKTYVTNGGGPFYCSDTLINSLGRVVPRPINDGQYCSRTESCNNGQCTIDEVGTIPVNAQKLVGLPGSIVSTPVFQITNMSSAMIQLSGHPDAEFRICSDPRCYSYEIVRDWGKQPHLLQRSEDLSTAEIQFLQIRTRTTEESYPLYLTAALHNSMKIDVIPGVNVFITPGFVSQPEDTRGLKDIRANCKYYHHYEAQTIGVYDVWLSTSTSDPKSRFTTVNKAFPYYIRLDDQSLHKIADSWADLTDGSLDFQIPVGNYTIWTGTKSDGTRMSNDPANFFNDWYLPTDSSRTLYYEPYNYASSWSENLKNGSYKAYTKYLCFQQ